MESNEKFENNEVFDLKRKKKDSSPNSAEQLWHSTFLLYKSIAHLSPKIFLHRNLRYRKHFANNSNNTHTRCNKRPFSRCSGETESIPKRAKLDHFSNTSQKQFNDSDVDCAGDLQVFLHGVKDESGVFDEVDAEAIITKINGSKINESGSFEDSSTKSIGNFKFRCQNNSKSLSSPVVFTVPKEVFSPLNGHLIWTSWLMLKCTLHAAKSKERLLRRLGHRQSSEWRPTPSIVRTAILPLCSGGQSSLTPGRMDLKFWKTGRTDNLLADSLKVVFPLCQNNGLSSSKTNGKLDTDTSMWLKSEVRWTNGSVCNNKSAAACESPNFVKIRLKTNDSALLNILQTPPPSQHHQPQSPRSRRSSCSPAKLKSLVPSNLEYRFIRSSCDRNGSQSLKLDSKPDNPSRCPVCRSWCEDLYCLLKHLRTCHFRFAFCYKNFGDKHIIEVKLNRSSDYKDEVLSSHLTDGRGRSWRNESIVFYRKSTNPNLYFDSDRNLDEFRYPASLTTLLSTVACTTKPKRPNDAFKRVFYCGETCVPLTKEEVDKNDTEQVAPEWLCSTRKKLIDEFSDVNLAEKEIMKAWNEHILKNNCFGDDRMFSVCQSFWQDYGEMILLANCKANYSLHLANLCNDGVLSQKEFYHLMLMIKSGVKFKPK